MYIRFEKYNMSTGMNGDGWKSVDGKGQTNGTWRTSDENWETSNKTVMDANKWEHWQNYDGDGNDVTERSASTSFVAMASKREEKFFFLLLRVFFNYYFIRFFNESWSLFLWSFVQRAGRDGNRKMIFE
jgi:Flp pilus assembly protein TadG